MSASLLPLPDDPRFQALIDEWTMWEQRGIFPGLRSSWLKAFEDGLREFYPQASSRDRSLTARHYAPFYLRDGPNVP